METEITYETLAHTSQHDVLFPKTTVYIRNAVGTSCATRYILTHLQDAQSTYNVTLERVRVTVVAVVKQRVLHILNVCF